jgi:hypothetical protein
MSEEFLNDENQKRLDLSLENKTLENEFMLKTGAEIHNSEDCDPFIHNQFLKNVLAFEEADKEPDIPVKSLFPADFELPDEKALSDEQIVQKLNEIYDILSSNNIKFGFATELPDRILYKHLTQDFIPDELIHPSTLAGFTCILDGCNGDCPECFQKDYCATGRNYEDCDK